MGYIVTHQLELLVVEQMPNMMPRSGEEVIEKLDRIMTNAFNSVADLAEERKCYTRDAAYLISLQRVARAVEGRGWVKPKK